MRIPECGKLATSEVRDIAAVSEQVTVRVMVVNWALLRFLPPHFVKASICMVKVSNSNKVRVSVSFVIF